MTNNNRRLLEAFFNAIAQGDVPDELVTPDMTFWSINGGEADRARFHGAMKILSSIFGGTLVYRIESLICEDDRVAAEISSQGTFTDGEPFSNTHIFLFRIRDGRIASAKEFMNQFAVKEKIVPRMQAAMAKREDN